MRNTSYWQLLNGTQSDITAPIMAARLQGVKREALASDGSDPIPSDTVGVLGGKHEYRNLKSETHPKHQIQMTEMLSPAGVSV